MINTVINNLLKSGFNKNKPLIISVSTGVDSMVLLDLVYKLKLDIIVVHFNHNKRDQSIDEELFIKEYCSTLSINLRIKHIIEDNVNFQNNARYKRYEYLEEIARKYKTNQVLVAHHGNDNIETVLIKILRGSNISGYSGLKFKISRNNIDIYRPLLSFSKNEIYEYAKSNNIKYFEDYSNLDTSYLRNNIRINYVNNLVNSFDNAINKFNEYSSNLFEINNYLNKEINKYYNNKMNIAEFNNLDIVLKRGIISKMTESIIELDKSKIDIIIDFISTNKYNTSIDIGNSYKLVKEYVIFYVANSVVSSKVNVIINKENTLYNINDKFSIILNPIDIKSNNFIVNICYNEFSNFFTVRNKLDGDYINMPYGTKKIKDLFIDKKIPTKMRNEILLLANLDSNEILYIFDLNIVNFIYKENLIIK